MGSVWWPAKYFDKAPTIIRVIAVLSLLLGTLGIRTYIVMVLVVSLEGSEVTLPKDAIKEDR